MAGLTLLSFSLLIGVVEAMQYVRVNRGIEAYSTGYVVHSNLTLDEAKKRCYHIYCPGFGCTNVGLGYYGMRCYTMHNDWQAIGNQEVRNCSDCTFYQKPPTCASNKCPPDTDCVDMNSTVIFEGEERMYQCCPQYHCGPNCQTTNFNHRGGTFVKGTTIGTNPYRDLSVVQCQELCIRMSCKAINHVVVTATGAFECFLFSQDHTDVPLVVNLIKLRYNNYYQRTKVCEYGLNRAIEDFY